MLSKAAKKIYKYIIECSFRFSKFKRVIIAEFSLNGRTVFVPVLHLTSDKSKFKLDTGSKRSYQLKVVYEKTCPKDNTSKSVRVKSHVTE